MKKVIINEKLNEKQKKQFEAISDEYVFYYDEDHFDAEILVGNFSPLKCKNYPNLELILSTYAGVDAFIKKDVLSDKCLLCSGANTHNEEVAEHMLAVLLEMEKNLHHYRDNQNRNEWSDEGKVKSISDLNVLILGLGNIGKHLALLLKSLGMHVIGIKRNINNKIENVDELYTMDQLDKLLPQVDVVMNVLPSTKETKHLFTIDKFKLMKKDALLINGGRGDLIDTNVLVEVLEKNIIRGVGQDVFESEPLPKESKLWKLSNLVITPHVAGFFHLDKCRQKWVDICTENLKRYLEGKELINFVKERE